MTIIRKENKEKAVSIESEVLINRKRHLENKRKEIIQSIEDAERNGEKERQNSLKRELQKIKADVENIAESIAMKGLLLQGRIG